MPFQAIAAGRPAAEITRANLLERHNETCPDDQKTIITPPNEIPRYIILVRKNYDPNTFSQYPGIEVTPDSIKVTSSIFVVDTLSGPTAAEWIENCINKPTQCNDAGRLSPISNYNKNLASCSYTVKRMNTIHERTREKQQE